MARSAMLSITPSSVPVGILSRLKSNSISYRAGSIAAFVDVNVSAKVGVGATNAINSSALINRLFLMMERG